MFKRMMILCLALCMLACTALAQSPAATPTVDPAASAEPTVTAEPTATPAPRVPDQVFTMMGYDDSSTGRMWEQSLFFQRMLERTGIGFTFQQFTDMGKFNEAKALAFASGDLPDVFFKAHLTVEEEMRGLESGQLVNLAPLLATSAPTVSSILTARPDWARIVTQPSGGIASLPSLNGNERQNYVWLNQVWLDTLGLSMPTNLEEFTNTLRAFRDHDLNENGKKDEIPFSFIGPWEAKFLLHAWGLAPNDYNIYVDGAGTVQFAPKQPAYRDFVTWLRAALAEGIIDPSTFRQSQSIRTTKYMEDKTAYLGGAVTMAMFTLVNTDLAPNYAVMPPLAYNGEQVYRQLLTGVTRGTFAITSACKDPAALLAWVDFLYTDEGGILATAGLQDVDYFFHESGAWSWVDDDFRNASDVLRESVIRSDSVTPGLEPADFMRRTSVALDANTRLQGNAIRPSLREPFPVYWPQDAGREARIAEIQANLGTYVDEAIAKFATGEWDLTDATWNAFQTELDARGAQELTALFQTIYGEQ